MMMMLGTATCSTFALQPREKKERRNHENVSNKEDNYTWMCGERGWVVMVTIDTSKGSRNSSSVTRSCVDFERIRQGPFSHSQLDLPSPSFLNLCPLFSSLTFFFFLSLVIHILFLTSWVFFHPRPRSQLDLPSLLPPLFFSLLLFLLVASFIFFVAFLSFTTSTDP